MSRAAGARARLSATRALVGLVALSSPAGAAWADALDDVQRTGTLVWAADQEGGGPYVLPRDDDPSRVTGFEVELADALAARLGARASFQQGNWDKLGDLVHAEKAHVVLNGYEWTPARAASFEATLPYYVYRLRLLARAGDASLSSWQALSRPSSPRRVGVLTASAADELVTARFGASVTLVRYDGNTDAMREVETGKLDATVQDTPIVAFYLARFPGLAVVGEPVGEGHYVMLAKKGETRLVRALNEALREVVASGEHERILRRWALFDDAQGAIARLADDARFFGYPALTRGAAGESPLGSPGPVVRVGERPRGLSVVRAHGLTLVRAAGLTVLLTALAFPLAAALGLFVALGRFYGSRPLSRVLGAYVELVRGTPLMLQLYVLFFVLPEIGVRLPAMVTAVLGLAINYSAYEAEIQRAGLASVPHGQLEAALALGMTRGVALRRVVLPQAARVALPPMVSDLIALFKDTSVCSVITLVELTKRYSVLAMSTQAIVELVLLTAALYLAMSLPLAHLSRRLEARLEGRSEREARP